MRPIVTVLTQIPSPYQVELFNALTKDERIQLRVIYLDRMSAFRQWEAQGASHTYISLAEGVGTCVAAEKWIDESDLAVFSWYADRRARALLHRREASRRPWCLWGERPGASGWGLLGRIRRRLLVRPLMRSRAPVWGMGQWAVEAWRRELGADREYRNIPYFSDLSRFARLGSRTRSAESMRILFSGTLIRRKG